MYVPSQGRYCQQKLILCPRWMLVAFCWGLGRERKEGGHWLAN